VVGVSSVPVCVQEVYLSFLAMRKSTGAESGACRSRHSGGHEIWKRGGQTRWVFACVYESSRWKLQPLRTESYNQLTRHVNLYVLLTMDRGLSCVSASVWTHVGYWMTCDSQPGGSFERFCFVQAFV